MRGAAVVFESTGSPGATEEVCIPVREKQSGLKWKQDFFLAEGQASTKRPGLRG
jgi:UDP-N-acetyl-D-galactosamine dehydrogenase